MRHENIILLDQMDRLHRELVGSRQPQRMVAPVGWNEMKSSVKDIRAKVITIPGFDTPIKGTVTADGTEQTIAETSCNICHYLEGNIDLTNIQGADQLRVRVYIKIKQAGNYILYADYTYKLPFQAGAGKLVSVKHEGAYYSIKVTVQQIAGAFRDYDYLFLRRREGAV